MAKMYEVIAKRIGNQKPESVILNITDDKDKARRLLRFHKCDMIHDREHHYSLHHLKEVSHSEVLQKLNMNKVYQIIAEDRIFEDYLDYDVVIATFANKDEAEEALEKYKFNEKFETWFTNIRHYRIKEVKFDTLDKVPERVKDCVYWLPFNCDNHWDFERIRFEPKKSLTPEFEIGKLEIKDKYRFEGTEDKAIYIGFISVLPKETYDDVIKRIRKFVDEIELPERVYKLKGRKQKSEKSKK